LAITAEEDENNTYDPIIKHPAYTIKNIEFTLEELDSNKTSGNPWTTEADFQLICTRLPQPIVEEHYPFYMQFLLLSEIIQNRGHRIKCFRPGLRLEGRAISGKSLLLTLFPIMRKEWEVELLCDYLVAHCTYLQQARRSVPKRTGNTFTCSYNVET
jgi:hypothetical protein